MFISFVAPVYNEEGSLKQLHQELLAVSDKLNKPCEIIYVDDGSTDDSPQILADLSPATVITLRRNFGQTAALDAGIHQAQGKYIVTLDSDLQNDPADVPKMLRQLEQDELDVVCGWRSDRKDSWFRKLISGGSHFFRRYLVNDGINDSGCTLRIYRNECFSGLHIKGEMHRFIPALLRWRGFEIGEIKVNHRQRQSGKSKYGVKRIVKGFLDMFNLWFWRKYENRPLHMFGSLGILLMGSSFMLALCLIYRRLFTGFSLQNKIWPFVAMTGFTAGLQLFVLGLLANLIIENRADKKFYEIKAIRKKTT